VYRLRGRLDYLLVFTPFITDWVDTGHLPHTFRELVTELILGGLIAIGIWRLHREADRMRAMAESDTLTGLPNRRRFDADLHREVARAHRLGTPLVLAYVDVNGFKQVNDREGHLAGDRVLKRVADLLRRSTREGVDAAYRLGGDEFALIFTNTEPEDARSALRRASHPPGGERPVEISVGVVLLGQGEGEAALLERADRVMYQTKRGPDGDPSGMRLVAG